MGKEIELMSSNESRMKRLWNGVFVLAVSSVMCCLSGCSCVSQTSDSGQGDGADGEMAGVHDDGLQQGQAADAAPGEDAEEVEREEEQIDWRTLQVDPKLFTKKGDDFLSVNLDSLSYAELNAIKFLPYARKGVWPDDYALRAFYCYYVAWYKTHCYDMAVINLKRDLRKRGLDLIEEAFSKPHNKDNKDFSTNMSEVVLTDAECEFVGKVEAEMKRREAKYGGRSVLSPMLCMNGAHINGATDEFWEHMAKYNFAMSAQERYVQYFNIYEFNEYHNFPSFITTDVALNLFALHHQFVLKRLEFRCFSPKLLSFCKAMNAKAAEMAKTAGLDEREKSALEYVETYFAIAGKTFGQNLKVPKSQARNYAEVTAGIAKSDARECKWEGIEVQYSVFKPTGHYTRKKSWKSYYRGFKWLQKGLQTLKDEKYNPDEASVGRVAMMALVFNCLKEQEREDFKTVSKALDYVMGRANGASIVDVANMMAENGIETAQSAVSHETAAKVMAYVGALEGSMRLVKDAQTDRRLPVSVLPARYTLDADVMQSMVSPKGDNGRLLPRTLDVFSTFGVGEADLVKDKYYNESERWNGYEAKNADAKQQLGGFDEWHSTFNNEWLSMLIEMQKDGRESPNLLRTEAWRRKELNTALVSYTNMAHSSVLYRQTFGMAECGDWQELMLSAVKIPNFVEPNLRFWETMTALLDTVQNLATRMSVMDAQLKTNCKDIKEFVDQCLKATQKELAGEAGFYLDSRETSVDCGAPTILGGEMERLTLNLLDYDNNIGMWGELNGPDRSVEQATDLGGRNGVMLHNAIGMPSIIYVLVEYGGRQVLCRGAVSTHFEFADERSVLTDEAWQGMRGKGALKSSYADSSEVYDGVDISRWMAPLYLRDTKIELREGETIGDSWMNMNN